MQNQQAEGMGEEGSPGRIVRYIGVTYKKLPGNIKFGETNTSSKKSSRTVLDVIKRIPWRQKRERTFHAIFRSATNLSENDLSFKRTKDKKTEVD